MQCSLTTIRIRAFDYIQMKEMDAYIKQIMEYGEIPGLALIMVSPYESIIKTYGYSNTAKKVNITPLTTFELGPSSQPFTGLAMAHLEEEGLVKLDRYVSDYLPWFHVAYNGKKAPITLKQLLYHTSGIPASTLSYLEPSTSYKALEKDVRNLIGIELRDEPGNTFQYAAMNYNILGLIIQKVSHRTYENYMHDYIFRPLGMHYSQAGIHLEDPLRSQGHKVSYNRAWLYPSPIYRGGTPASYIASNGEDMSRWLNIQLGIMEHTYQDIIARTHDTNQINNMHSMGMGWIQDIRDTEILYQSGRNPNFSTFTMMNKAKKQGVAVLANSNSRYTNHIGQYVMKKLGAYEHLELDEPHAVRDRICSHISMVLTCIILIQLLILGLYIREVKKEKRIQRVYDHHQLRRWLLRVVFTYLAYILTIHVILRVGYKTNWRTFALWNPDSCAIAIIIFGIVLGMGHIIYGYNFIYPKSKVYTKNPDMGEEREHISA